MAGGIIGGIVASVLPGVLPSITETVGKLVDRLVPDPVAAAQAKKELEEVITAREATLVAAIQQQNSEQNAINLEYAKSDSIFKSGARPAAMWICVCALGYQFLFAPIVTWAGAIIGTALGVSFPVPPTALMSELMPLTINLLGLAALRSVDKNNGVSDNAPAPRVARR
jgi:Na+-transporting methylmalonyl-CoA/oxaloacetate decarboxylase gamma subunit